VVYYAPEQEACTYFTIGRSHLAIRFWPTAKPKGVNSQRQIANLNGRTLALQGIAPQILVLKNLAKAHALRSVRKHHLLRPYHFTIHHEAISVHARHVVAMLVQHLVHAELQAQVLLPEGLAL
jgi:hypothetical protein